MSESSPIHSPSPLPSTSFRETASALAVVSDEDAIVALIDQLLYRSGMSAAELARRLGIARQSLNQYREGRRKNPSVYWLARLASACGARILVEFPAKPL